MPTPGLRRALGTHDRVGVDLPRRTAELISSLSSYETTVNERIHRAHEAGVVRQQEAVISSYLGTDERAIERSVSARLLPVVRTGGVATDLGTPEPTRPGS